MLKEPRRVVIEGVEPEIDGGRFPIKRVIGDKVAVKADVFADGHEEITAFLLHRFEQNENWSRVPMEPLGNDRWGAAFEVHRFGFHYYTITAWVDHFRTWQRNLAKKYEFGQDIGAELLLGLDLIRTALIRAPSSVAERLRFFAESLDREKSDSEQAYSITQSTELAALVDACSLPRRETCFEKELKVWVDRKQAEFSAWYEFFPRSCGSDSKVHGTFADCVALLSDIAHMGFNVVYLPPIHPVGRTNRKGKNNVPQGTADDPGSPWAIGSSLGGHTSVNPQLGTLDDFMEFVRKANELGLEVALDLAFQCSLDHPYVREHPEWFRWRPDGSIQFAENPPKKYEDVVPLHFDTENWQELWDELKRVVLFWVEKGVRIFRVDNPHTKPFSFWEWLIAEVKTSYPDVLFLSEAFTRPKVMYRLAKLGFTQSYTYFTWRNTRHELTEYVTELTATSAKEVFRPNFWPNTPDILPEFLQYGGRPAFIIRLVLAATLSSNYGIYGPAFELCVSEAISGKEEYMDSEKYQITHWDREQPGNLRDLIRRMNRIRKVNPALHKTSNVRFYDVENEYLLFYGKITEDASNILLMVVNLDPFRTQAGVIHVPLAELGITERQPYLVHDLLGDEKYIWQGSGNYVELDPNVMPAKIFSVRRRMRREADFDYFL